MSINHGKVNLDYYEGLSENQVRIIISEVGLNYNKFAKWMYGQTCPMIYRTGRTGKLVERIGVYEYDLFRWIANQKARSPLIFD